MVDVSDTLRERHAGRISATDRVTETASAAGYCIAQYFLWFGSTFYGVCVWDTAEPSCSPLREQWQGNGDGGTFPQPMGVSRSPHHLL